ncbi:TerB family tellurite resistance protein [Belliella aquatica]|uniref:TerB family tellurite resistance protein n=1 Tax=Belliella aquatica TaxID=1323734 RepID=A0ABQ1LZC4_9BACT|nr:TerB family tellurite resistance protein [Belliella aquatica]MCH7406847.1 TerB family tellurite resistance protein [Belliella aquatica]GGC32239.1 hypothetical protein GCM10010993_09050 [Belliella aquatica]
MKSYTYAILLLFFLTLNSSKSKAQEQEVVQLLLNVEKLEQFRGIYSNMLNGYQILTRGYNGIRDLSQGNFSLHKVFMDGLSEVNPNISNYRRVGEIIRFQAFILQTYRAAYNSFRNAGVYRMEELDYLMAVYQNLFKLSLRNLDEVIMIITSGSLTMSDEQRLKAIDRIHSESDSMFKFLISFNNNVKALGLMRQKDKNSMATLEEINR